MESGNQILTPSEDTRKMLLYYYSKLRELLQAEEIRLAGLGLIDQSTGVSLAAQRARRLFTDSFR